MTKTMTKQEFLQFIRDQNKFNVLTWREVLTTTHIILEESNLPTDTFHVIYIELSHVHFFAQQSFENPATGFKYKFTIPEEVVQLINE